MEIIKLEKDVRLICTTSGPFPDGIEDAIVELHSKIPFDAGRNYYGIAKKEKDNDNITFTAATEEKYPGEAGKFNCSTAILRKGNYAVITIENFRGKKDKILQTFYKLNTLPEADPESYSIQQYLNDRVAIKCMVRLKN